MTSREYTNGSIAVLWDSDKCTHCEKCFTELPEVFNPDDRPWVDINGANDTEIIDQVGKCPSGALSMGTVKK